MSKRKSNAVLRNEQEYYQKNKLYHQRHENTINFNPQKQRRTVELVPKTLNQESYILALQNPDVDVVTVSGPAGTGKTYLAILSAIMAYRNREYDRIVLTRPSVSIENESHGFLPGDLNAKLEPWMKPMIDVFREYYNIKEIEHMLAEELVEFAPLGMMRGRTFKRTWLMLDEAQNATPQQLKMLLTRIGEGSKFVISGDIEQTDRKTKDNGLMDLEDKLTKTAVPGMVHCRFDGRDIQRHRLIGEVLKLYR